MLWSTVLLFAVIAVTKGECPEGCDQPVAIYRDLQCTPVYAKQGDCCPLKYDCSNVARRPAGKCTYRGRTYALREAIPREETYGNCKIGCSCRETDQITCAILDCPEWLGMRPKAGNHLTYTLNECCSTGQKSAPFATCQVGEAEYKEGQRFDGPKRCTECVCRQGWKGQFEAPFCMQTTCTEEMENIPKIKANCAPSYFGSSCCPFRWVCPNDAEAKDDKIILKDNKDASKKQEGCMFGAKLFAVGDKLERIEPISSSNHFEIKCECIIPPFMTCLQKQVFDMEKTPQHVKDALGLKD